jgi:hypothetical protein
MLVSIGTFSCRSYRESGSLLLCVVKLGLDDTIYDGDVRDKKQHSCVLGRHGSKALRQKK